MRSQFLGKLSNPLHKLTRADIERCVELWSEQDKTPMLLFSPYRWGRLSTWGKPRSIYQLTQLTAQWKDKDKKEPLTDHEAKCIADIIQERDQRASHSAEDFRSNASEIFYGLVRCKEINRFLPETRLPDDVPGFCSELEPRLSSMSMVSGAQRSIARIYLQQLSVLDRDKKIVAASLSRGEIYKTGIVFYLKGTDDTPPTYEQSLDIIDQFLKSIIEAAKKLARHHALPRFFNAISGGHTCMMGKSRLVLQEGEKVQADADHKFATAHDLMGAIFEELELNARELGLEGFKKIILDQYNNQEFDSFKVTEQFVEVWLRKNIVDEPEERKDVIPRLN